MSEPLRYGMIVPSSNVTMEREIPVMLRRREQTCPETFSFHSSRVPMTSVAPEQLAAMNAQAAWAASELADVAVDIVTCACLVAVMAEGRGAHREAEASRAGLLADEGCFAPVVSDALVLSGCVQMPSLEAVEAVEAAERAVGSPVISTATATVFQSMKRLGPRTRVPGWGHLLSGAYDEQDRLVGAA